MRGRAFPWHSFLFAMYFVLYFWSKNLAVPFLEVFPPLLFFLIFSVFVVLILGFIIRDFRKAGIIVTLFLILFFSYGHAHGLLINTKLFGIEIGRHSYFLIGWAIVLVIAGIFIIILRKEKILNDVTDFLNLTGLLLMVFVLFPVISYQLKNAVSIQKNIVSQKLGVANSAAVGTYSKGDSKTLPDIYYIILDSYMNQDVLSDELGFDDGEFCGFLQKKGFFVSSSSRSNYVWTVLSLPSSLNFRYFNDNNKKREDDLLYNNETTAILKRKGYKIISVGGVAIKADLRYEYGPARDFLPSLFDNTWIYPLTFFGCFNSFLYKYQRECILYNFDKLNEIPAIKESTFTFAHIASPHPPYIFGKNGSPLSFNLLDFNTLRDNKKRGDLWYRSECSTYIGQVIFMNHKVEVLINNILSFSPDSIIIIQGDHGPLLGGSEDNPSERTWKLKTSILNAYYLPNLKGSLLYHGISPVNSFRIVFNSYFGGKYELLPDINYFSSRSDLWNFNIVKEKGKKFND
jgi:hypothetical protein